jgi:hypothetical protein
MKKTVICLLLAALLSLTLLSCSQEQEEVFDLDLSGNSELNFDGLGLKVLVSFFSGNSAVAGDNILGYPVGTGLAELATNRIADTEKSLNCKVNIDYREWGSFTSYFTGSLAAGSSPADFAFITSFDIYSYAKAGYLSGIASQLGDIIDYRDSDKWGTPNLLECACYKDDLYGILPAAWPDLIYSSFGYPLVVNEDLISIVGASDPRELYEQGVWNWSTFNDELEKCTVTEGGETITYGLTAHSPYFAEMILASNGVGLTRVNGKPSMTCGFYNNPSYFSAAEEIQLIRFGDLAYTYYLSVEGDPVTVTDSFCNDMACYSFMPTKYIFGVYGDVSQKVENYAVVHTPVGPDVAPDHAAGIYDGMTCTIVFPSLTDNLNEAAIAVNEIFSPLPGYETHEQVIEYMRRNNFFDSRDCDAFLDILNNAMYNYFYSAGGDVRNIPSDLGRTNTPAAEILERHENLMNDFFDNAVGDMLAAYSMLFPEQFE